MKIKVLKHTNILANVDDDFQKVINYYKSDFVQQYIQEEITFDISETSIDLKQVYPNSLQYEGKYDAVMYLYQMGSFPIYAQTVPVTPKLSVILGSTSTIEDNIDYTWKLMAHEILHAIVYKRMTETQTVIPNLLDHPIVNGQVSDYYGNDNPYLVGGNFEQQLKTLVNKPMYKYFKDSEVVNLKPELVHKLDQTRGEAGIPFKITSGFRTVAQNSAVGGKVNSAHLTGEAVDLACNDSVSRLKIVKALLNQGFTRVEIATAHVHCDISKTLPQNVLILSDDN